MYMDVNSGITEISRTAKGRDAMQRLLLIDVVKHTYLALCQQSRELALLEDDHVLLYRCYLRHHTLQHDLLPKSHNQYTS